MQKRVAVRWGVAVGVVAVALGHLGYWYLPRERSGRDPSPEAMALLADPGASLAVWIAYPHQNLGRLERFVGDAAAWGALLSGRDREAAERLPRFGPFVAPPASELALALPDGGKEPGALVRTYTTVALLAKAAGRLAGNPWLAGGTVGAGPGRTVAWDGELWRYGLPADRSGPPFGLVAHESSLLALVRTDRPLGPLPAGTYRLVRDELGLELRLGEVLEVEPRLPDGPDRPAALLIERPARRQLSMILIWEDEGVIPPFPAAASIIRRGSPRPRLPGEELLRLVGRRPQRETVDGLEISALSGRELERARRLLPELQALASSPANARAVAIVDPPGALRVARRLEEGFSAFPLAALLGADPKRWLELLGPWEGCGPMALVVSMREDAARVWLCPPSSGAAAVSAGAR